jgi:hypothetical protein
MPGFLEQLFGGKPRVPTVPQLDLGTEQQKAIDQNQAALPGAEKLVSDTNQFSMDQITQMLNQAIPGYSATQAQLGKNLASEAKGEIPQDVSDRILNMDAGKALGGGYAGSGAHSALEARDLGLTSLDLTNKALVDTENWMKTASALYEPSQINVSSMFVNPSQRASFDVSERNTQTSQACLANQIEAMADPTVVGEWNLGMGGLKGITSAIGSSGTGGASAGGGL